MFEKEMIEVLSKAPIFYGLNNDDFANLVKVCKKTVCKQETIMIEEGKPNLNFYIIVEGTMEAFLPKDSQTADRLANLPLNTMGPGVCLGEYSFIDKNPASASVRALTDVTLLKINRMDFDTTIKTNNRLGKLVYRNMCQMLITRLRSKDRELDMMNFDSIGSVQGHSKELE